MRLLALAVLLVACGSHCSDVDSKTSDNSGDPASLPQAEEGDRGDQVDDFDYYDQVDEFSDDYEESGHFTTLYNENKAVNRLHQHHDVLSKLFGSDNELLDQMYNDLHNPTQLSLAKSKLYIQHAVTDVRKVPVLNSTERQQITDAISILDGRMAELMTSEPDSELAEKLFAEGLKLALVLPVSMVNGNLVHLYGERDDRNWGCSSGYLVNMWKEVVDAERASPTTAEVHSEAIASLVRLRQALEGSTNRDPEKEKIKLLVMLSRERNRVFATKALGGVQQLEDLIQNVLCSPLSMSEINDVLQKLTTFHHRPGLTSPISDPTEMTTLIEIQTTLAEITKDVASRPTGALRTVGLPDLGRHILDSYMDLVDNTVGMSAANIWAQMPLDEVNKKLHHMLLSNERYVGTLSDVILSDGTADGTNYTLEKASLSVSISKLHFKGNVSAEFEYNDTVIKTDEMSSLDIADGDDLRVYTLRYKSWSQMIEEILDSHFDLETGNSSRHDGHERRKRSLDEFATFNDTSKNNKSFIGKGGIVSLSTRQNGVKRSVPVTFWIGFANGDSERISHRCFSCEYLDSETVTWETGGCRVVRVDGKGITCKCNHTTNFAAFMMPAEMMFSMTAQESKTLIFLSLAGSFLSIFGLALSLSVFFFVRNLIRNERLKAHVHLTIALLAVHIIFVCGEISLKNDAACVVSTVLVHYFLTAAFMWMLVEGIFLYLYVVQVFLRSKIASYNWMYVVGWGVPVLLVAVTAGYGIPLDVYVMPSTEQEAAPQCPEGSIHHGLGDNTTAGPKYGRCWLSTESGIIWAFLVPVILVLLFNSVIMCKTMKICLKSLRNSAKMKSRNDPYRLGGKYHSALSSDKHSTSNRHSDSYEQFNSGEQSKTGNGRGPKCAGYVVSGSPCLLQVTTEEEEGELKHRDVETSSVASSKEHSPEENEAVGSHVPCSDTDSFEPQQRYHSVSGKATSTTVSTSRPSVIYKNSISHSDSPKLAVKAKSFGTNMARLASERTNFFIEARASVKGTIVLLPILGVPWICGLLAPLHQVFTFLFVVLNSIQGLAIFVVYCLFNGEIRRAVQRRLAVHDMKHSVDAGIRRTSSTSTVRSFLRFGRRRSTVTTSI